MSLDISQDAQTKGICVRKGFMNGTLSLSRRNAGSTGSGDICKLQGGEQELLTNTKLYIQLWQFAEKHNLVIK